MDIDAAQGLASSLSSELSMKLTGVAKPEEPFFRRIVWEALEDRLPRGAQAQVKMQVAEVLPGAWSDWHVHNGPSFHLILQGQIALERVCDEPDVPGRSQGIYHDYYEAGQAFAEPIGIPHRAGNPHSSIPIIGVTLHLTEMDRHPIVTLGPDRPKGTYV